jgi:hypothetical protein
VRLLFRIFVALVILSATPSIPAQNDPALKLWLSIKQALRGPNGQTWFESNLKDAFVPAGMEGVRSFTGTVLSSTPEAHPGELILALSDKQTPEVTLHFIDEHGKAAHAKKPIPSGTRVAFDGIAKAFTSDPFMLTFEAGLANKLAGTDLAVYVEASGPPAPASPISVNYPSSAGDRFISIGFDGFSLRRLNVNGHGATTQAAGLPLESFLRTAGWSSIPEDEKSRYLVEADGIGGESVTLTLLEIEPGTFDRRAWLIVSDPPSPGSRASLAVVGADGNVIQRVDGIQRIRVFPRLPTPVP